MRARHLLLLGLLLSTSLVVCAQDEDVIAAEDGGSGDSVAEEPESPPPSPPPPSPPPPPKRKAASVLSVDSAEAQVITAGGKKQSTKSAKFGSALLDGLALDVGASIEVTFTPKTDGAASKPQQAMLVLAPAGAADIAAYAVAKPRKDGSHAAVVSQSAVEKQLGPVGGKLVATLLLGDPQAPKGVRWELGSILLPPGDESAKPAPAYRSARVQQINNLLPNIAHIFRAPEKRPPAVVSLVFTGLALAPLALLALWLLASGALSLPAFPSGPAALWALLFHGGIGALLVLYWLFWTQLDLAQTLPLAIGIGLATAAVGYKALSALADARLQAERAAATPAKKTN